MNEHQFIFIGLSRERTNFFDLAEWANYVFEYEKLTETVTYGQLNYLTVYFTLGEDMKHWNKDKTMPKTLEMLENELKKLKLCDGNDKRSTKLLVTEESLWTVEHGYRENWKNFTQAFLSKLVSLCASNSNVQIVYKTATSLRNQYGSLSWQRMYEATRVAKEIAQSLDLFVLDSFMVTQPLTPEKWAFPDGLHLFSDIKFQGNIVSKTISMMFLKQVCSK